MRLTFSVLLSYAVLVTFQSVLITLTGTQGLLREYEFAAYVAAVSAATASARCSSGIRLKKGGAKGGARCALICALCLILMLGANLLTGFASGEAVQPERTVRQVIFAAFFGVLLKPAIEEYLFRGLYLSALEGAFVNVPCGEHLSVAITSILFALWHESYPLLALFCAAVLGELAVYLRRKNVNRPILYTVFAHAAYNAVLYAWEFATVMSS